MDLIMILFVFFLLFLGLKIFTKVKEIKQLENLVTPLVIGTLFIAFLIFMVSQPSKFAFFVALGLLFSAIGDTILLNENAYLEGSIFFFIVHIFYIIAFIMLIPFHWSLIVIGIILLGSLVYFYIQFFPKLTTVMKICIPIYMLSMTTMATVMIGLYATWLNNLLIVIGLGGLLFWLSDLILAINKFLVPIKGAEILIWMLYAIGQLLIASSILII